MSEQDPDKKRWFIFGAMTIALMGSAALWRLSIPSPDAGVELPEDPAARATLFRKHLRENPLPTDAKSRKPARKEWERWLAEHGTADENAQTPETADSPQRGTPPPVFDFGTAELPRADPNAPLPRIEPNEFLDEEDLRHPEIFFEMAQHKPEYSRLEVRLDVHRFFTRYRRQLRGDLNRLHERGGDPDEISAVRAAIGRYDDAIEKMEALIAKQAAREDQPMAR